MTRPEFVALLAMLVRQRQITQAQSDAALDLFDSGDLTPDRLPLPVAEAMPSDDSMKEALLLLLLLLGDSDMTRLLQGRPVPLLRRQRVRDDLRLRFESEAQRLARSLPAAGVQGWHRAMRRAARDTLLGGYIVGLGRMPNGAEATRIADAVRSQMAHLYRFAGTLAVIEMSAAAIVNRAIQYNGRLIEWFQRGVEGADTTSGYVYDYIDRDDAKVCPACRDAGANGPYLPNEGPMPGQVCYARGRCRCERRRRYAPEEYARLMGTR